ncbi:MAG: phosphoglucosamine mutase [Methanobacteriota archaeon]|nr:MAG: phosphoglucosamine mutase [Euryarchaeota archaeon]
MNRLFGTNGVRGIVNSDMNVNLAVDLGRAIGTFFREGEVAIASDTITSADMLKNAVVAGVLSTGLSVSDLGVLPSPSLQFAVKKTNYSGGIIITASHNPPEFNGVKVIDSLGLELARKDEEEIEAHYFRKSFRTSDWQTIGGTRLDNRWKDEYVQGVVGKLDAESIRKAGFKVVLDCANGAGYQTSPDIMDRLGCEVVLLNDEPDGRFPGHPSEPTPANLKDLATTVEKSNADIGIAHDGDADRTIFVDENADFVDGDKSLALMALFVLKERKGSVVTPVSSSSCVGDVVKESGGNILYSKVGAPIVARTMLEKKAVFGGEENGGMIFPEHQYCRDGAMAAGKMIEILAESGESLSKLISKLPEYHLQKMKVICPDDKKEKALALMEKSLSTKEIDKTDGLKIYGESEWVLVRSSGTEPIVRVYAEAKDKSRAEELAKEYADILKDAVEQAS